MTWNTAFIEALRMLFNFLVMGVFVFIGLERSEESGTLLFKGIRRKLRITWERLRRAWRGARI